MEQRGHLGRAALPWEDRRCPPSSGTEVAQRLGCGQSRGAARPAARRRGENLQREAPAWPHGPIKSSVCFPGPALSLAAEDDSKRRATGQVTPSGHGARAGDRDILGWAARRGDPGPAI